MPAGLGALLFCTFPPPTRSAVSTCRHSIGDVSSRYAHVVRRLVTMKSFMMLFFGMGCLVGSFNTLLSLVDQVLPPPVSDHGTIIMGLFFGLGIIGTFVESVLVDGQWAWTHMRRLSIKFCLHMSMLDSCGRCVVPSKGTLDCVRRYWCRDSLVSGTCPLP